MTDPMDRLVELMQADLQYQRDLAQVLREKLTAMRGRDLEGLEALTGRQQHLLEQLAGNGQRRVEVIRQAMARYMPARQGRLATARELAEVAGGPVRSRILALAALLMEATEEVQRMNRINEMASRRILGCMDHIFQIIAQSGKDIGLYGRAGKKAPVEPNRLVDAIA